MPNPFLTANNGMNMLGYVPFTPHMTNIMPRPPVASSRSRRNIQPPRVMMAAGGSLTSPTRGNSGASSKRTTPAQQTSPAAK